MFGKHDFVVLRSAYVYLLQQFQIQKPMDSKVGIKLLLTCIVKEGNFVPSTSVP